jgi:hypothetical protein
VAWRHSIALVLLLALTGMPVGGMVCALICDSAQTASHHGTDQQCEEAARSASGPQISGVSGHDCSMHDASIRQVARIASERVDLSARSAPAVVATTEHEVVSRHDRQSAFDDIAPPGTAPPTTTPAVLRV